MARETTSDREKNIQTGREHDGGSTARGLSRTSQAGPVSEAPFSLMQRVARDMDRLFDRFGFGGRLQRSWFDDFWTESGREQQALWSPQLEVVQRGDKLVVQADLPGLRKEDIDVEVDNGVLTISGERKHEHEEDRDGYYRTERSYGRFYRSLPLPKGVTGEQVEATFDNGVLEVQLPAPKQESRKEKKIQIR